MTSSDTISVARENAYRLLAACYYSPGQTLIEESCFQNLATILTELSPEAAALATETAQIVAKTDLQEMLVEHTRLFVGPFQLPAPPYGSVWLEQEKSLMGKSTIKVASFYADCGLQLAEDNHQVPDHIAVELEFVSYLVFRQREAALAGNHDEASRQISLQKEFLASFLLPWLGLFTDAVINDAEAPPYMALARCTKAFVFADYDLLKNSEKA